MPMSASHQQYLEWTGGRFCKWAERIVPSTCQVVDAILTSKRVEQQPYCSCVGLLKLADKYSLDRFEAACQKSLSFTATPSYKSIKNILDTGSDRMEDPRMKGISFEDRFGMLVDIEYSNRKSNSLKRLIRNAGFD